MRKNLTIISFALCIGVFIFGFSSFAQRSKKVKKEKKKIANVLPAKQNHEGFEKLKKLTTYRDEYPEPKFENLNMIGNVCLFGVEGDMGKVLRALRFENITDVAEKKYEKLPDHLILSMMLIESCGVDLLGNGQGDGGFGLCHMQPIVAKNLGLHVYKDCKGMVCDGKDKRSCRDKKGRKLNHAKELRNLIEAKNFDRKLLVGYDDRLHPILNIDAAARSLSMDMEGKRIGELTALQTAIRRYAGKYNYRSYYKEVKRFMALLNNKTFMKKLEDTFNKANPNFTINGKHADFWDYIHASQKQNYNYGLAEYEKFNKPAILMMELTPLVTY